VGDSDETARGRQRSLVSCATLVALTLIFQITTAALAQFPIAPPAFPRPGDERLPLPPFETGPKFELPPPPTPAMPRQLPPGAGVRFVLRAVRIIGNTAIPTAELEREVVPYLGRAIGTADLEEIRLRLTRLYIERGYVNSGAIIPDQRVADGTVTIRIVEGALTTIEVTGLDRLRAEYVAGRLRLAGGPPLNAGTLQDAVQILLQDPLIDRVNAELGPGLRPGESRLDVRVKEQPLLGVSLGLANDRAPSIGGTEGQLQLTFRDLSGYGDLSVFRFDKTSGLQDYTLDAEIPLSVRGTRLHLSAERTEADQVEAPFNAIDVASSNRSYEVGLFHPFYRTPSQTLEFGATFAYRESTTYLLGEPFSFSPGVQDGVSKVSVLRFSQSWTDRGADTVLAARSTFSVGFDGFGATVNPAPLPDGRFFSWLGQAQYARRLAENGTQVILRADAQLAADPLLPIEQFAIGGINTVRGYREDELVRDNGLDASVEFRIPVWRPVLPGREDFDLGPIQLAAFADYGRAWNTGQPTPSPRAISSIGIGLLWNPVPKVHMALYYGYALQNVPTPPSHSLQDYGIHFRLIVEAF